MKRLFMRNINNLLHKIKKKKYSFPKKLLIGVFLFPLIIAYAFCESLFVLFRSPYSSFQFYSKQKRDGTFVASYDQHIAFKKKTRLLSLTSVAVVIISIVFVNLISVSLYQPEDVQIARAADPYSQDCSGTAGSPTPVTESNLTDKDVTFNDTGGDGYCELNTAVTAASVIINTGVVITHPVEDLDGITISTTGNFEIASGAFINADSKGCQGVASQDGFGPNIAGDGSCTQGTSYGGAGDGSGNSGTQGAGHGGLGGIGSGTTYKNGGAVYDSAVAPAYLGSSGGGATGGVGGAGGGLIRLDITGAFTHNGTLSVDGGAGTGGSYAAGGGAGGSIYITSGSIAGTTGTFSADGGNGYDAASHNGGGGGGGRIAVTYTSATYSFDSSDFTATGGLGPDNAIDGDKGTVYVEDTDDNIVNIYHGFTYAADYSESSWTVDSSATNQYCDGSDATPSITVTGALTLAGTLDCTHASITGFDTAVGVSVALSGLTFNLGPADIWTMNDAVPVTFTSSTINSNVRWTNMTNLSIDNTSSINTNELGCQGVNQADGIGPNGSNVCGAQAGWGDGNANYAGNQGAGHGGNSGLGSTTSANGGGATYDSAATPVLIGSSGGGASGARGGHGGGLVQLQLTGTFTHNGALSADGGAGTGTSYAGGGGSGGSIYITAGSVIEDGGATGTFSAKGGSGFDAASHDGGGGGGGRISISGVDPDSLITNLIEVTVVAGGTATGTAVAGSTGSLTATIYTTPDQPTATAPSGADKLRNPTGTTSAYSSNGAPHTTTDWQISDDDTFSDSDCSDTNIVWCAIDNANKESVVVNTTNGAFQNTLNGKAFLAPSTTYYIRSRHTNTAGDSTWSSSVSFTTVANNSPDTPTNSTPANGVIDQSKNPTLTSSVYSDADSDPHTSSDWFIYESSDCSGTAQWSKEDDVTNKTSIIVNTTNGAFADVHAGKTTLKAHTIYSFKTRYNDSYNDSSYSSCTSFTTANVALVLDSDIPTQSLTEDIDVANAINLNSYYSDADWNDDDLYVCTATNDLAPSLGTMSISGAGMVSFDLVDNANGADTISITCQDAGNATRVSNTIPVNVTATNDSPTANAGADQVVIEGSDVTLDSSASSDVDTGDTLTATWTEITDSSDGCTRSGDTVTTLDKESGYDCVYGLTINDGTVDSAQDTMTITITADNDAPIQTTLNDVDIDEGETLMIVASATDQDTSSLTMSASNVPAGASFADGGNNSGTLDWETDYDDAGDYTITFNATDGENSVTQEVNITVNDVVLNEAPEFGTEDLPNLAFYAGTTITPFELDDYFTDADGDALTYTTSGNSDVEITITDGEVSMTTDEDYSGSESIYFTATDPDGESANSNSIVISISQLVEDGIGRLEGDNKGTGEVTLYDDEGEEITSFIAFNEGGVIPRLGGTKSDSYIYCIKNKSGSSLRVFSMSGRKLMAKKLSPKVHYRKLAVGNLDKNKNSEEIVIATKRGSTVYFKVFSYRPTKAKKNRFKLRKKARYKHVRKAYRINITKKKVLLIINKKGKTVNRWKPFK